MKILTVAGARPNFMKVAPFLRKIAKFNSMNESDLDKPRIQSLLVHTGQHYDENMSDIFFRELRIQNPDINLCVGSGSHAVQTADILIKFEKVCKGEKPDWVVVVGDVNSTMACALVCSKLSIRIAHIEAGLRSYDRTMPEEINRVVTDAISDLLFTPSSDADENLRREGVAAAKIKMVGNIMIDSLLENLERARKTEILSRFQIKRMQFIYVTIHRPANVDRADGLMAILNTLKSLEKGYRIIFPIHPRTQKILGEAGIDFQKENNDFLVLEPIGYHESLCLTENARLVVTDSGGLQEESTFFRTPCLTLRPNTERPITITSGSNRLTNIMSLKSDIFKMLEGPERLGKIPPLWDGLTAGRILEYILSA